MKALTVLLIVLLAACAPATAPDPPPPSPRLPVSHADLQTAADLAEVVAGEYLAREPGESPQSYVARLRPLITQELARALSRTPVTKEPAMAGPRKAQSIRAINPEAVTIVVEIRLEGTADLQHLAVTVVRTRGGWKAHDIQPADSGDDGDTP